MMLTFLLEVSRVHSLGWTCVAKEKKWRDSEKKFAPCVCSLRCIRLMHWYITILARLMPIYIERKRYSADVRDDKSLSTCRVTLYGGRWPVLEI